MNGLSIAGVQVAQDGEGRFRLNDFHRASGGEKRHSPNYWLGTSQSSELVTELETTGKPVVTIEGRNGGTFVCKEMVYAYAMWISAKFHLHVIRTFDVAVAPQPQPITHLDTARMLVASLEETQRVSQERDHAIATKAQIGSKREATAMATASAKSREAAALREQLGVNERHATIIAVERATGIKFPKNSYVSLRRWCKAHDVDPTEVVDPRYGTVKAWPAAAWREAHAIDLSEVFGGVAA